MVLLDELRVTMSDYRKDLKELYEVLGIEKAQARYDALQKQVADPDFYSDLENSQKVLQEVKSLENRIEKYQKMEETLDDMTEHCFQSYFDENMIPSCNRNDIEHLLKFYAQKAVAPLFVTIDEMERKKLDVSEIAKKIYDEDMRRSEKNAYIQSLWAEGASRRQLR